MAFRLNEKRFKSEMLKAKTFRDLGERADYWGGFMRGLRRRFHGENFGEPGDHEKWMSLGKDARDQNRIDLGQGYRDGFQVE